MKKIILMLILPVSLTMAGMSTTVEDDCEFIILEKQNLNDKLSKIDTESITTLYKWNCEQYLHIDKDDLYDSKNSLNSLKQLFQEYNLKPTYDWDENRWEEATNSALHISKRPKIACMVPLAGLASLLRAAKSFLKSFVPSKLPALLDTSFIEKSGLERLFTYTKLHHVMVEKKLSHVHLPLKMLVLQNTDTLEYIIGEAALDILDKIINIYAAPTLTSCIGYDQTNYEILVFAEYKVPHKVPLNADAQKDMLILLSEAPFDVGYHNIFSDANGDAIIIDTECKGAGQESITKFLSRYVKHS